MVVCDACHRDPATGKFFLLGLFSMIGAREFPCRHPRLSVYVSLTDGLGTFPLELKLVHVDAEEKQIFDQEQEISLEDPRMVCEVVFQIDGLVIPGPGEYRLQLFANRDFLLERRIIVYSVETSGESNE